MEKLIVNSFKTTHLRVGLSESALALADGKTCELKISLKEQANTKCGKQSTPLE
jgi:hypothetical protein